MFSGMHYVYEVYKTKSFSKAAKNLYISQPALSAMIKKIEGKVNRTSEMVQEGDGAAQAKGGMKRESKEMQSHNLQ